MAPEPEDEPPPYRVYRSRRGLLRGRRDGAEERLENLGRAPARNGTDSDEPAPYTVHRRSRLRPLRADRQDRRNRQDRPDRLRRALRPGRVLGYLLLAVLGWGLVSLLLFLVSAQLQRDDVSDRAGAVLDDAGYTATSPNTVLVLGSDARTQDTAEPGAQLGERGRSDTILLMRVGGGRAARLSIPRDTVVEIPGVGRAKVNAAYSRGGPELTIATLQQYLGIEINHLVEVSFANFPAFIDALGGIDYSGGCVVSRINGGYRNGGYTLRLRRGSNHLDGEAALALARTRKNECNPNENDRTRARRQQKILAAIKDRIVSPSTLLRLPLVSWSAPKAIRSDMAGPSLLGLFASVATAGTPGSRVLRPSGTVRLPDGGDALVVSEAEKRRAVRRFLAG